MGPIQARIELRRHSALPGRRANYTLRRSQPDGVDDARSIPRYADAMKNVPELVQIDAAAAARDAELERKEWE